MEIVTKERMHRFVREYLTKCQSMDEDDNIEKDIGEDVSDDDIKIIYNLFHDNIISEPTKINFSYYYGIYHEEQKDYDNMIKYYKMASERQHVRAMRGLAAHYQRKGMYDDMLKYYLLAIGLVIPIQCTHWDIITNMLKKIMLK